MQYQNNNSVMGRFFMITFYYVETILEFSFFFFWLCFYSLTLWSPLRWEDICVQIVILGMEITGRLK